MSLISDMKIEWHMFKIIKSKNNLKSSDIKKRIQNKDFSNLDLSNCDLLLFPFEYWKGANIENTNFSNSKINFTPKYLPVQTKSLKNVNFENVDLSYLKNEDFSSVTLIENCNFHNTGLKVNINSYINNVKFDKEMTIDSTAEVDIKTIELNEDYPFLDGQIVSAIIQEIKKQDKKKSISPVVKEARYYYYIHESFGINLDEYYKRIDEYIDKIIKYLEKFKKDKLINLIEKLRKNMDLIDVFAFLSSYNTVMDLYFKNIDFNKDDIEIISKWFANNPVEKSYDNWYFRNSNDKREKTFENCTFDTSYIDAFNNIEKSRDSLLFYQSRIEYGCKFINCSFSNTSFQNEGRKTGYVLPTFSCNTSAYIKLGNMCNGKCEFCKNNTETKEATNIENIIKSLCDEKILPHLNQIYFGGGEPSLYLDEIKKIIIEYYKKVKSQLPNSYMFTNGSCDWEKIEKFMKEIEEYYSKLNIIISRQDIENENNKKIVGLDCSLDDPYLKELLNKKRILFALTCNEMNMRENFLMDYLKFGNEIGVRNFIIQDLESKTCMEVPFIEEYLKEFEQYLISKGFKKTRIVSSSYFDMNLFKSEDSTVALKRYFNPSELEERFKYCPKHSFDLAIDSNGDIYHDYQMIKRLK